MGKTLDTQLAEALQQVKYNYFDRNAAMFDVRFAGVKVGRLDSDGKLSIIAPEQNVEILNARWCAVVKNYIFNRDVRQVVFVSARQLQPEPVAELVEDSNEDKTLSVEISYSGEYDSIVRPERIVAIPKYFFRHISRIGAENAWLYIGFRQAAYQSGLHGGVQQMRLPAAQVCRWAGIREITFWRRIAKPETWKALKGFVVQGKPGDWTQNNPDGKPHREPNRYTVSMTIPLTPGDVVSLRSFLIDEAEHVGTEQAMENALSVPPKRLIPGLVQDANCDPMTVYQIVTSLGGSAQAASKLQAHLMPYSDVVVMTQYFVESWLPKLGEPGAWMIAWMRDHCNARGQITASIQNIMNVTGVERERTIRDWLRGAGVYQLFVREDPKSKARGAASMRDLVVRLSEPLENELDAIATHRSTGDPAELVGDASIRNTDPDDNRSVLQDELVGDDSIRDGDLTSNWSALQIGRPETAENAQLVGDDSIRKADSAANWSEMIGKLVGDDSIRDEKDSPIGRRCYENWSEMIESISINNKTLLNIDNDLTTTINYDSIRGLNARAGEEGEGTDNPSGSPEASDHQAVVAGPENEFLSDPDEFPEAQAQQGVVEESGIEVFPENDTGEETEIEPVDPQQLFQQILKHANVTPKIQQRFKGKPFYPFLCWLIYGASLEPIDDPVGFAISRYGQGLPDSQDIKDLARDLDGLLDDLDYFKAHFILSNQLHTVFEEKWDRARLLANIIGN